MGNTTHGSIVNLVEDSASQTIQRIVFVDDRHSSRIVRMKMLSAKQAQEMFRAYLVSLMPAPAYQPAANNQARPNDETATAYFR
jgi:hypothetical protein